MTYGYVRVSSRDQNEERQIIAMHEFGIEDKQIYLDKQSGKDFDRPRYRKLMRRLKCNDTLVIKSIDRLGRNYDEILVQWRTITKQKKAAIVVLDMPLLDTRQNRDLTGTLIADNPLRFFDHKNSYFTFHDPNIIIRAGPTATGPAFMHKRLIVFFKPFCNIILQCDCRCLHL